MIDQNKRKRSGSKLSTICGVIGILGCLAAMIANLVGIIVVERHNFISETISKLAIGKYAWIQDLGLDLLAVGFLAIAVGLYTWNLGGWKWKIGTILLGLLSLVILVIAEYNEYADRGSLGATIHLFCVCILALFFSILTLLLAPGLRKIGRNWSRFSIGTSIIWTVLAPFFFVIRTSWDGAYERFLALIMFIWMMAVSWLLIKRGMGVLKNSF